MCITPYTGALTIGDMGKFSDMVDAIGNTVNQFRAYGYDCKFVNMKDLVFTKENGNADNSGHPNASGMLYIAERVEHIWKNAYH